MKSIEDTIDSLEKEIMILNKSINLLQEKADKTNYLDDEETYGQLKRATALRNSYEAKVEILNDLYISRKRNDEENKRNAEENNRYSDKSWLIYGLIAVVADLCIIAILWRFFA